MKTLIRLISIANRLDQKELRKEADQLDAIIRKLSQAWPHDDDDDESLFAGIDDDDMPGPTEEELMAMEQGIDLFQGEDLRLLQERLKTLTQEMQIFSEDLIDGNLTAKDLEVFEEIKKEFTEVSELIREKEADILDSTRFEA